MYVFPQKQLWLRQKDAEIEGCINHIYIRSGGDDALGQAFCSATII